MEGSSRAAEGRALRRRGNQWDIGIEARERRPGSIRCQCPTDEEDTDGPRHWAALSRVRARVPGRGPARLRLLLRAAGGRLRLRAHRRPGQPGAHRRRSPDRSGATATCCRSTTTPRSTWAPASPRWCGPTGWRPSSDWASCGSRTTRPTPPARSRTGWSRWPSPRPASLGFKVAACASTGNLANSVAAHAARAGMASVVLIPHDLEEAKVTMTAVYGGHGGGGGGHLRRREPAVRRADQRAPQLGLRQRQRAHLLRRGLQDPGLRGGRAAGLARPPTTSWCPSPRAASWSRWPRASTSWAGSACSRGRRRCGCRGPRRPAARRWPPPSPRGPTPSGR